MSGRILVTITFSLIAAIAAYISYSRYRQREEPHSYRPREPRNEGRSGNMRQNQEKSGNSNRNCRICDESLNSDEQEKITLNLCGHTFHELCLQSYQLVRSMDNEDPNVCPIISCRASFL